MGSSRKRATKQYLRKVSLVVAIIGTVFVIVGIVRRDYLPYFVSRKPDIAAAILPPSDSERSLAWSKLFTKKEIGYVIQDTLEIPTVLKIANTSKDDVVVTSIEAIATVDEIIAKEDIPVEIYRVEPEGYVRTYVVIDDKSERETQSSGFPLLVQNRHETTIRFYATFNVHLFHMSDTKVTRYRIFPAMNEIKIQIQFLRKTPMTLTILREDLPRLCQGGIGWMLQDFTEEEKVLISQEHAAQIQRIMDTWSLDETNITSVTTRETLIPYSGLGSADVLIEYEIEYTEGGVIRIVKVYDWEIDEKIKRYSPEAFIEETKGRP